MPQREASASLRRGCYPGLGCWGSVCMLRFAMVARLENDHPGVRNMMDQGVAHRAGSYELHPATTSPQLANIDTRMIIVIAPAPRGSFRPGRHASDGQSTQATRSTSST